MARSPPDFRSFPVAFRHSELFIRSRRQVGCPRCFWRTRDFFFLLLLRSHGENERETRGGPRSYRKLRNWRGLTRVLASKALCKHNATKFTPELCYRHDNAKNARSVNEPAKLSWCSSSLQAILRPSPIKLTSRSSSYRSGTWSINRMNLPADFHTRVTDEMQGEL